MPPKKSTAASDPPPSDGSDGSDGEDVLDKYKPLSFIAVAEMAGWWPGMGNILLPVDPNTSRGRKSHHTLTTTTRLRTAESLERELIDNFCDADSEAHGFSMVTGSQSRFLQALAEIEYEECRARKRKGAHYPISYKIEEHFPAAHYGTSPKRKGVSDPHLTEKYLEPDKKTGKSEIQVTCKWSPTMIRNKIQKLLQDPHTSLTIAKLCEEMDISQAEYCKFMQRKKVDNALGSEFYVKAAYYLAEKEEGFVRLDKKSSKKRKSSDGNGNNEGDDEDDADPNAGNNKKAKTSGKKTKSSGKDSGKDGSKDSSGTSTNANADANAKADASVKDNGKPKTKKELKEEENAKFDVSDVQLEEYADLEAEGKVPVFATCDSIREQIDAHLKSECEHRTKADLLRSLGDQLPPLGTRKMQSNQLTRFEAKSGPRDGAGSSVLYAGYLFFEKLRIKRGEPKSDFRMEMERIWGRNGMDRTDDSDGGWFTLREGESIPDNGHYSIYGVWSGP